MEWHLLRLISWFGARRVFHIGDKQVAAEWCAIHDHHSISDVLYAIVGEARLKSLWRTFSSSISLS